MDTTVCLACVLVSAICRHLFYPLGLLSFYFFEKKFQKLDSDLNECFQNLGVILESLKCQEETKKSL